MFKVNLFVHSAGRRLDQRRRRMLAVVSLPSQRSVRPGETPACRVRQNWSCETIPSSQNSDILAASFSSVVVNIASSVQKVSYYKPLPNKSRCLNTMKSFLTFKVINTRIHLYFQNVLTMKRWQNIRCTTAILFCFILTAQRGEYNVIVRYSEPIRLLESPRSLSVYILKDVNFGTRLSVR